MWVLGSTFAAFILTTGCGEPSHSRAEASSSDARLGFSTRAMVQERDAEAKYAAQLSTESISQFHRRITKRPHIAGSPASMAVAETIRKGLENAGLQTEVHEFQVYLSTPRSISAELVEPVKEDAECARARESAGPGLGESGIGPGVRGVFRFGRSSSTGGVRELWIAARLCQGGSRRRRRPRQDRDGPLCQEPSGGEDPYRAGARGRGHHYL